LQGLVLYFVFDCNLTSKVTQHPLVPACITELMLGARSMKLRKKLRHSDDMKNSEIF